MVAGALATGGLLALSVPAAQAQAKAFTVTFTTPGQADWTVPAGVSSVFVTAYGGQGGSGDPQLGNYGQGGRAAKVSAQVPVTPGLHLDLTVAGAGHGATGGIGGGGQGGLGTVPGTGGGGATSVTAAGVPILVAAGGGGTASFGITGGDSGQPGGSGSAKSDAAPGGVPNALHRAPAGAGGSSAGISPSCSLALAGPAGTDGVASAGGSGGGRDENGFVPRSGGGGGGGGYVGGGGGGGGAYCASSGFFRSGSGGGGGGGSSFVDRYLTDTSILQGVGTGDGTLSITYEDTAGPVSNPVTTPQPNSAGWNNSEVTVDWNWTDAISGVDPAHCTQSTTSGAGSSVGILLSATCQDLAGNLSRSRSISVKIDLAAPQASPTTSGRSVNGWSRGPATIAWNWADNLSGLDHSTCRATSPVAGHGTHVTTVTCKDVAGNTATAQRVTRIDNTAPRVHVQRPKHRTYHRGQHVTVKYHCHDTGVGVARCHGSVAKHHALPTKRLGKHTFRVKAKDRLGNTRIVKIHYRVVR
jgi:hypothetical protein